MVNNSKKEQNYESIKSQINSLKIQVSHNKEKDLQTFKDEIREYLEDEIVSRYYFQKGTVEASFDNDEDVLAAIKIFNNPDEFGKLLTNKQKQ